MRLTSWLRALAAIALCSTAGSALYTATRVVPDPATGIPSEAALRCRDEALTLVPGTTEAAVTAGGDGIVRGTLSGPDFEAEWACTYAEGLSGWYVTAGLTDIK